MADKLRSVNTRFWEDTFIEELSISEKLLFLYLLTNSQTNILGIYEISIKRISYDTGLNKETVQKAFERFGKVQKAYFKDNFVILPNFLKNQRLNSNMKTGVANIFNELPNWLKESVLNDDSKGLGNDSKGFETILNGLVKYEIEIEIESKKEEIESNNDLKELVEIIYNSYPSKCPVGNRSTGKTSKNKDKINSMLKNMSKDDLISKIEWYISDCKKTNTYIKNFGSFLNNLPDTEGSKPEVKTIDKTLFVCMFKADTNKYVMSEEDIPAHEERNQTKCNQKIETKNQEYINLYLSGKKRI